MGGAKIARVMGRQRRRGRYEALERLADRVNEGRFSRRMGEEEADWQFRMFLGENVRRIKLLKCRRCRELANPQYAPLIDAILDDLRESTEAVTPLDAALASETWIVKDRALELIKALRDDIDIGRKLQAVSTKVQALGVVSLPALRTCSRRERFELYQEMLMWDHEMTLNTRSRKFERALREFRQLLDELRREFGTNREE